MRWTLLLLLVAAPPCVAQADAAGAGTPATPVEADWILDRLARPAPMRTAFVELRGSALLKAPLRLEGEYLRPRGDTLVREVRSPYTETTTIREGAVSIARGGRSARTFSLSRAPELASLQRSFGALLSGDRALLEEHYRLASQGTRERWTLSLTPKAADLAAQLQHITLYGRGAELRCIETHPREGDPQRTLLAGAAREAAGLATAEELAGLCRGDGASLR